MDSRNDRTVRDTVEEILERYPEATLQDVYKNFFQDAFGPGHMITDTARARAYLEQELAEMDETDSIQWLPLGIKNNYYRINLSLVRDGTIPEQALFLAFVESANTTYPPALDEWKVEWQSMLAEISRMKRKPGNFESDRAMINKLLGEGKYVVHHSDVFSENYHPHYRIVSKQHFQELKSKYLDK
jgi:hypothetical protein